MCFLQREKKMFNSVKFFSFSQELDFTLTKCTVQLYENVFHSYTVILVGIHHIPNVP